jgi:hypothetical protein
MIWEITPRFFPPTAWVLSANMGFAVRVVGKYSGHFWKIGTNSGKNLALDSRHAIEQAQGCAAWSIAERVAKCE